MSFFFLLMCKSFRPIDITDIIQYVIYASEVRKIVKWFGWNKNPEFRSFDSLRVYNVRFSIRYKNVSKLAINKKCSSSGKIYHIPMIK